MLAARLGLSAIARDLTWTKSCPSQRPFQKGSGGGAGRGPRTSGTPGGGPGGRPEEPTPLLQPGGLEEERSGGGHCKCRGGAVGPSQARLRRNDNNTAIP